MDRISFEFVIISDRSRCNVFSSIEISNGLPWASGRTMNFDLDDRPKRVNVQFKHTHTQTQQPQHVIFLTVVDVLTRKALYNRIISIFV